MSLLRSRALAAVRCSVLVAVLAAPAMAVVGCTGPLDEDEAALEGALSGREFEEGSILRVTAASLNVRVAGNPNARLVTSLRRDELVTVVSTSGRQGWVNIRTSDGDEGWASATFLVLEGDGPEQGDVAPAVGDTCQASRAEGAVNPFEKALHDTIAYAEGTRDVGNDGYDILFGGSAFASCGRHPNRCVRYRRTCSTAAGRYQFLYTTWRSISNTLGYATFEPENQERAAEYLIKTVRRASVPSDRALTSTEFTNVMNKISYEWASLPPGRYGQPMKSLSELRRLYCSKVSCG